MLSKRTLITEKEFDEELQRAISATDDEAYEECVGLSTNQTYRSVQMLAIATVIYETYCTNPEFDLVDLYDRLKYVRLPVAGYLFSPEIKEYYESLNLDIPFCKIEQYVDCIYMGDLIKCGFRLNLKINSFLREVVVGFSMSMIKKARRLMELDS